jgi:threonine aldolase
VASLRKQDIICSGFGKQTVRFVTHLDFTDAMLEKTLTALKTL